MTSESHVPEIGIDHLLKQIRQSAALNREESQPPPAQLTERLAVPLDIDLAGTKDLIGYIQGLLETAESRGSIRTKWPDKFNRFPLIIFKPLQGLFFSLLKLFFKDQREVNFNLIESLKQSLLLNQDLLQQITTLRAQAHTDLQNSHNYAAEVERQWKSGIGQMQSQIQSVQENCYTRLDRHDRRFNHTEKRLNSTEHRLDSTEHRLDSTEHRLDSTEHRLDSTEHRLDLGQVKLRTLEEHFQEIDKRNFRDISFLKNDLVQQKRLITLLLERFLNDGSQPLNSEPVKVSSEEESHFLDAFYTAFEDEFRGSREEITDRFKVYLPSIKEAKIGTAESPILDVGCGRGEWLELLGEFQYLATGIDLNRVMVEECGARGLDVKEAEAISYLKSLPEESLGGVTGFHIIEHLPFSELIALFEETRRVLRPGGLVIFETPNPRNVAVGSYNFYFDPTHRNPLPSPLIKFVAEFKGFENVEIMNLHPCPETLRLTGSELADRFSDYFYGPQDYAVIGFKP